MSAFIMRPGSFVTNTHPVEPDVPIGLARRFPDATIVARTEPDEGISGSTTTSRRHES